MKNHTSERALREPGTVLLDTARPDAENRRSLLFTRPVCVLQAHTLEAVPPLLASLDEAVADGYYLAGYLAYEAGYAFEAVARAARLPLPLAWFGVYEAPEEAGVARPASAGHFSVSQARFDVDRATYLEKIAAIKRHIREGDVYQINFTGKVVFDFSGDAVAFYQALRRQQRVSYGAFLNTGDACVLSLSPELFFRREGNRVVTRPMKGTVRRGRTVEEDDALARWLAADEKSRAENLMIVDLLRNDLSICCQPGTVQVPALYATERYGTLIQMTSTVEGRLREAVGYAALFRALFPCGSVTGAPKIRAMQLIHALEDGPRGVYCGAIGYIAPNRTAAFSVAIRTAVLRGGQGEMGVGSGVVWDSDPDAEYDECLLKARFFAQSGEDDGAFQLIETMRWDGAVTLLPYHVDRMAASAAYFGFPFEEARFHDAWRQGVAALSPGKPYKVRVTLDEEGRFAVSTTRLDAETAPVLCVTLAEERVDSQDIFRYHKTTRRRLYEEALARAQTAGFDEVLFRNEREEVTEGACTNVFVQKGDAWYTPPLACGVLPGVFRRHVLDAYAGAEERVLTVTDLAEADAIYLCNAVRGLRRAAFVGVPGAALRECK